MKLKTYLKSAIAGFTAFAMAVTMLPTAGLENVQAAATDESMILHWDMTLNEDGTLKDLTGNNHNGTIEGVTESGQIEGIDVLELKPDPSDTAEGKSGGYAIIPNGTISSDATELTINMLVKIAQNKPGSWMWCIGNSWKHYLYFTGCCSKNQGQVMRGGACHVPGDNGNGWSFETVISGNEALTENVWQNITVTYKDGGKFIFYKNGEKQQEIDVTSGAAGTNGQFTLQDLMKADDELDGYMGRSFYRYQGDHDPDFLGKVADFRIYNKEMSETEVTELYTDIDTMLKNLAEGDFTASDVHLTEDDCLGGNTSKDEITTNLSLPETTTIGSNNIEGQITNWVSSDPTVISNNGEVTRPLIDKTVTMTATVKRNDVTVEIPLTFKVSGSATPDDLAGLDADSISIPNKDDIRGNISLPSKGTYGSDITWTSSNDNVINSKANGTIPAGEVKRQENDTSITLTATIKNGNSQEKIKTFECNVKKAYEMPETTDYIFAYFPYTSIKDERIYFGISEDGLNFSALNDGKFVLESTLGTHGLRDPFIIRSPEGDRFYLIATDLTVAGLEQNGTSYPGQGWSENQTQGSQKIMVWESTDLVNWSQQRECKVAADNAGCTWAPEAYWDDATGQYVVFWASKTSDDNYGKQRVFYATTRDFYTFSKAKVWIEAPGSVIDTTVIKVGDYYYRYTKNEDGNTINGTPSKRVYCEKSNSLTAETWTRVANNSLDVSGGQIEGPCIFKLNTDDAENARNVAALKGFTLSGDDIYCLTADKTGATIFPGLSDNIETGTFNVLGTGKTEEVNGTKIYSMPEPDASHGTIMPITAEEYHNLMKKYNSEYAAVADEYYNKATEAAEAFTASIPSEIAPDQTQLSLPTSAINNATVTWKSSNENIISSSTGNVTHAADKDTTVTLTAVITLKTNNTAVRDQVRRKYYTVTVKKAENTDNDNNNNTPVKFTVTFDSKGGSKVNNVTVEKGKTISAPKTTRKNYTFAGWYNGNTKYNFKNPVNGNLTLTAKWTKVTVGTPKAPTLKNTKGKLTITVKKVKGASGYQFTYSTDKKFKKGKTTTKTTTKNTLTIKKPKKGKTYYVKVKAYKKDSTNKNVLGKFSKVKKIKIKK